MSLLFMSIKRRGPKKNRQQILCFFGAGPCEGGGGQNPQTPVDIFPKRNRYPNGYPSGVDPLTESERTKPRLAESRREPAVGDDVALSDIRSPPPCLQRPVFSVRGAAAAVDRLFVKTHEIIGVGSTSPGFFSNFSRFSICFFIHFKRTTSVLERNVTPESA